MEMIGRMTDRWSRRARKLRLFITLAHSKSPGLGTSLTIVLAGSLLEKLTLSAMRSRSAETVHIASRRGQEKQKKLRARGTGAANELMSRTADFEQKSGVGLTVPGRRLVPSPNGRPVALVRSDGKSRLSGQGISPYTGQKTKCKYRNRIRLYKVARKQSSDIHKTPYDRVKRCRERTKKKTRRPSASTNRIRLERAFQKQSSDTHVKPHMIEQSDARNVQKPSMCPSASM
ncbi:hypothetical protein PR048_022065 [Dryococelus australis]|uniref:Uncharacterized protein n=1 Tax=Dryococelus australis TaxID=614101 RepID=A0ABQ9H018_9NEOP|nr:hypothetical protein PR048_022065 [Dryococelus australis]